MNLKKTLFNDSILFRIKAETKNGVIEEMIQTLAAQGKVKDYDTVLRAVLDREAKMSTGMQHGIAIPHGKSDSVNELVALVGLKPEGIDFDALDEKPCTIFILTLSPLKRAGPHIQFLAEVSKLLSQPDFRKELLESPNPATALALLTA